MNTENWTLPHSLNKGYPFNGIESKRSMPNRPTITLDKETQKIIVEVNQDIFNTAPTDIPVERTPFEDFLMHRLFDFQETLSVAEGQIFDILEEHPFVPENYGFVLAHKNADITQPPSRIYVSAFDPRYSLFRKPAPEGFQMDPSAWTILKKNDDGTFHESEVIIPCDRIAYALFYAMRIKVSEEPVKEILSALMPINGPKGPLKDNYFRVRFLRNWERECVDIDETADVEADNVSDALTRAKFHFETSGNKEYSDIKPEELSIVS